MLGRHPERHLPLVHRPVQRALVHVDAGQQIVRVGVVGMPLEPMDRDAMRRFQIPLPAQRLAEQQEGQTARIAGEFLAPAADVVSHQHAPPTNA